MHDPYSMLATIRMPTIRAVREWWRMRRRTREEGAFLSPKYYAPVLAVVWHKDPERKGSDDSCDWFGRYWRASDPAVTKLVNELTSWEADPNYSRYFTCGVEMHVAEYPADTASGDPAHRFVSWRTSPGDSLALVALVLRTAAWRLDKRSPKRLMQWALDFISELHSDELFDPHKDPEQRRDAFATVVRYYLRCSRPWWRHPRWHVWHWRIQVPLLQLLRRWLFVRCAVCRGRFCWGESVYSGWSGGKVWHDRCDQSGGVVRDPSAKVVPQ